MRTFAGVVPRSGGNTEKAGEDMSNADAAEILVQVLAQVPDAVVLVDEHDEVGFINPAAEVLWGLTASAVQGRHAGALFPQGFRASGERVPADLAGHAALAVLPEHIDGLGASATDVPIERPDGAIRQGALSVCEFDVAGRRFRAAFVKDVTDQQRQRDEWLRLAMVVNSSDNGVIVAGLDGRISFVNAAITKMLGYELDEVAGRRLFESFVGLHTDADAVEQLHRIAERQPLVDAFRHDVLLYTKAGRPIWLCIGMTVVRDDANQPVNVLAVLTDITLTKMHEELQQKVLDAMARELPAAEVARILCVEVERIAPEVTASFLRVDAEGRLFTLAAPRLPQSVTRLMDGEPIGPCAGSCGTAAWRGEPVAVTDIATDPLWTAYRDLVQPLGLAACWSYPVKGTDGTVLGTFAFYYRDHHGPVAFHQSLVEIGLSLCALLLERERTRARIHQLAFRDTLTGLPNRTMLEAEAEGLLKDARNDGWDLALVFIDLDRFKRVNDTRGHATGDEVLCETGRRFKSVLREGDLLGRLAGDEFVAILPHCGPQQAQNVAERLLAAIAQPVVVGSATIHASASVGIAMFPVDGPDVETLLRHADIAMYHSKGQGPGGYSFFRAEMNRYVQEQALLEADLRVALQRDLLTLCYQPQFGGANAQELDGVEALLRWQHPTLGAVSPARFVVLAEECGLIGELDNWVMEQACRQLADWRARGVDIPRISINLSASDFRDCMLADRVARTLLAHGLQPRDLTLEMTESVMLSDEPMVASMIADLHRLGVKLSMDDFGTGYSSLGVLHKLPLDELKLDRSFVRDLDHSDSARALTATVLRIGEMLRMKVVAEGVETDTQRQFLLDHGCPVLQGYLLGRPMPADQLETWVRGVSVSSHA
ncbi:diguanylate cyclase/phosphodiesterase with PAS/PAC sensor(s) [Paraburkholderia caballeronis]|uniref:PAS domain S-box-containing protein/diguanylate cyclase (GGDEF) domain-containing protein n=2 Tax=Paraburkholderia caballeronis TaxID=416943 RepID=A0A1H7F1P4_9BURK|nr:diguanylate cyclase/phosphodiesterase with PAS/PAC sensor(s) [Paraburkholderia caballeronis]PXW93331.1 diguanylate cyclase/phosphodiesterase with PAS/PAC sensor(s) [Paraburkholderia caballeronis]RAJ87235.1 diguanylate cyclase/phosphodiesterase with PAS/PAC sensor(s) [Paraburkholderia caballeronis]SEE81111.1 diguanylate cyclase/phosphodiesterase with PAS/PAC sensor(s) [Paraburkholderia caballeronis]SEK18232.1 PAS domain S-box-containing protein/diguanylate cyclase (GGDEF) domain-containing pr